MRIKISILALILVFLTTSGFGCKTVNKKTKDAMQPITIEYWRVYDGEDAFEEIIQKYNALHPFITIKYKKLRYSEYEQELLNAFAEDRGPDIFSIHNTWIRKYQTKIIAMPESISMVYPIEQGTIKKEVIPEMRTTKSITLKDLKSKFVDVVYDDVVIDNQVYGLPLSVDTLAMFYNRDLLNNANITEVPKYWNREFQQDIKKLTKQDTRKGIIQSGVALGGSTNIERFSDIISVLMMQNGSTMLDNGQVMFQTVPTNARGTSYNPGLEALRFYTDFSNPAKEVYCWNQDLSPSLEMFSQGNLAIMFGYSYHIPMIQAQAPKLNFSVAPLPQIEGNSATINFANYWVEVVSKKSKYLNEAWDFIQFITAGEQAKIYLEQTKKPTALRSLVDGQKDDTEIGVFAEQVLTAKSWYKGQNPGAAETAIGEIITDAIKGEELKKALEIGANKVQQTIKQTNE
jgi:multiple sugar transport system substrate-binding protein